MTFGIVADRSYFFYGDVFRIVLFDIGQRPFKLFVDDILIGGGMIRRLAAGKNEVHDLEYVRLDKQLVVKALVMRIDQQLADQGFDLMMERMLLCQALRHEQLAVVDRIEVLFAAGIVRAACEQGKAKQDVIVSSGVIPVLTDSMDRLRVYDHDISRCKDILIVADRNAISSCQ